MIVTYITVTTFFNLFLMMIWGRETFLNLFLKVTFGVMAVYGAYLMFNLLPQVTLSSGMRVL